MYGFYTHHPLKAEQKKGSTTKLGLGPNDEVLPLLRSYVISLYLQIYRFIMIGIIVVVNCALFWSRNDEVLQF